MPVAKFIKARRDRALGSILGFAERELWSSLTPAQRSGLRAVIVDALNGFYDSMLDLLKSEDGVRNEEVVGLLNRLERSIREMERS